MRRLLNFIKNEIFTADYVTAATHVVSCVLLQFAIIFGTKSADPVRSVTLYALSVLFVIGDFFLSRLLGSRMHINRRIHFIDLLILIPVVFLLVYLYLFGNDFSVITIIVFEIGLVFERILLSIN